MVMRTMDLLRVGEEGVVAEVLCGAEEKRRLLDLGMIRGTRVCALFKSPYGEPTAYLVRGAVVALRRGDCKNIILE